MELLRLIESIRTPFLDTVVGLVTRLGEETIGIVLLCLILWCISKKTAYIIGVVFFMSSLTVQGMKICFRIDRPWVLDPTFEPVAGSKEHATGYSFPSGHTQTATTLYGGLGAQVKQKYLKAILFIIPFLVAFSRMYLGVHTLLDVAVSLGVTFLLIFLTVKFFTNDTVSRKRVILIPAIIVLYAVAVMITAVVMYNNGTIEERYIADCMKAAGAGLGFAVGMFVERTYIEFSVKTKGLLRQAIKFIIGIAVVLALQEGLKPILGSTFIADLARYFILLTWITLLYPLIIKRFFAAPE